MDQFLSIVQSLSQQEILHYQKRVGTDSIKWRMLELALEIDTRNLNDLVRKLNYQKNKSAFYTLKHRLIDDLVQLKLELGSNIITETEQMVGNLRILLFSQNSSLLVKTLQQLEKKVQQLEMYSAAREVYFCKYLFYYNNPKLRSESEEMLHLVNEKNQMFHQLEQVFFNMVFESLDIFYSFPGHQAEYFKGELLTAKTLHGKLKSTTSEFLWLSCKLTLELTPFQKLPANGFKQIEQLYNLYMDTPLKYRYPNCTFAIQVLLNKYYYLKGDAENFEHSLQELENNVEQIKQYRMYEHVLFYFLYIRVAYYVASGRYAEIQPYLEQHLTTTLIQNTSRKLRFYFTYLQAVGHFYNNRLLDCYASLLESRGFKNFLEENNQWVLLENLALGCLVQMKMKGSDRLDYELNLMKKTTRRLDDEIKDPYRKLIRSVSRHMRDSNRNQHTNTSKLQDEKQQLGILRLIDLRFIKEQNELV